MERLCGMLIPLVTSRKLPYVNLFNNVLLQERFKYLKLLPTIKEKVFSNFEEEEKTWSLQRVYSNELYDHEYEFYSPYETYTLTTSEVTKLKTCYRAILQKDDIEVIFFINFNNLYVYIYIYTLYVCISLFFFTFEFFFKEIIYIYIYRTLKSIVLSTENFEQRMVILYNLNSVGKKTIRDVIIFASR